MKIDPLEIKGKLEPIFQDVFDDDTLVIYPEMTAENVSGWDSVTHIMLITQVEKTFSIRFTTAEATSFENVGHFIQAISAKSGA